MAGGVETLASAQGKVSADNGLVMVGQTISGSPTKVAPIAQLPIKVDSNNALVVAFV